VQQARRDRSSEGSAARKIKVGKVPLGTDRPRDPSRNLDEHQSRSGHREEASMCAASCRFRENVRAGADVCSRVAPGTPEVPSAGIGTAPPAAAAGLCTPAARRRVPARATGTEYQWIGRKAIANDVKNFLREICCLA